MGLIKDEQKEQLKEKFKELSGNVKLIFFTQETDCQYCEQAKELLGDVAEISDKIVLEVHDFAADKEEVEKYKIDKVPATVVEGEKDYGIRFYGIPAGYEFTSLVDAIGFVSSGETGLSDETKSALSQLEEDVHIQVFITLSCPYCPKAVEMAHKLAMESDRVTADMVEAAEFPDLTQKYGVMAVPKMVVNEDTQFEGALPEKEFVENVSKALEKQ